MSSLILTVIELIFILGAMIFLHELGHFVASLLLGIPVEEFGFGYPPKMLTLFHWRDTEFTLNWIPFGGFVRPRGEDDVNVEGGIESQAPWKRLIVLLAGAFMNFITGVLVFTILFSQTGGVEVKGILVDRVLEASPAEEAGLMAQDIILSANGTAMYDLNQIITAIDQNPNQEMTFEIERAGETFTMLITPEASAEGDGQIGAGLTYALNEVPLNFLQATGYSFRTVGEMIKLTIQIPSMLISGQVSMEEARISGPVGIGQMLGQAREADIQQQQTGEADAFFANTMWLIGAIAVGLGFANLLPLPALDGGRIVFVLYEWIVGKRLNPKLETVIHGVGFILIIALSFLVMLNDIINPVNLPLP
ncbi:MAG: M50 family metallopeptidase [Anaerolineae bacterium]|jgi:regulator of sigma E protease|nr:M50 family metallopeptidase [Anaerolineae bacterium]